MSIAQELLQSYRSVETPLTPAAAERFRVNFLTHLARDLVTTPGGGSAWEQALDFARAIENDAAWEHVIHNGLDFGDVS